MGRCFALLAVACALALAGCGSVKNVTRGSGMEVYGGTRMSAADWAGGNSQNAGLFGPVIAPFWLADKPLCLAADTVTLPYVLAFQCLHPEHRKSDPFWHLFFSTTPAPAEVAPPPAAAEEVPPTAQEASAPAPLVTPGGPPPATPVP